MHMQHTANIGHPVLTVTAFNQWKHEMICEMPFHHAKPQGKENNSCIVECHWQAGPVDIRMLSKMVSQNNMVSCCRRNQPDGLLPKTPSICSVIQVHSLIPK